jgi:hypothetical protein
MGAGYFSGFSQIELIAPFKGYLSIMPLQIAALIYCWMFLRKTN